MQSSQFAWGFIIDPTVVEGEGQPEPEATEPRSEAAGETRTD